MYSPIQKLFERLQKQSLGTVRTGFIKMHEIARRKESANVINRQNEVPVIVSQNEVPVIVSLHPNNTSASQNV